ncbi:hypothetical protein BU23DRAFT_601211 [Bimuria novae-zelandiae CBS 107.79]|uniref:Uncharacterized protein n=1 Tax=Bimuria novae-zelandiae CBS 107.79 TaxID=1447943 RepID=A0A6A5UZ08_9PLEO|nr:hypothetical protein BU23DRAFT_601211 [Bimuria novae-zelandiae CBS 107.79]
MKLTKPRPQSLYKPFLKSTQKDISNTKASSEHAKPTANQSLYTRLKADRSIQPTPSLIMRPYNAHDRFYPHPHPPRPHRQPRGEALIDPAEVARLHAASPYARRVSLPNCVAEMPRVMPRGGYDHRSVSPVLRRRGACRRGYRTRKNFAGRGGVGVGGVLVEEV